MSNRTIRTREGTSVVTETQSRAKKSEVLFKKHKALMKEYYRFVPFKEPMMFFIRRTGKVEMYENVTLGRFCFTHSNKEERYIIIDRNQLELKVGDKKFKCYITHEDFPFPLPETPLLTTEMFDVTIDKTLHDRKDWEEKTLKARADLIWKFAIGIAVVIGAYALFRMVIPQHPDTTPEQAAIAAAQANMSNIPMG